jgi:hypothetical protein
MSSLSTPPSLEKIHAEMTPPPKLKSVPSQRQVIKRGHPEPFVYEEEPVTFHVAPVAPPEDFSIEVVQKPFDPNNTNLVGLMAVPNIKNSESNDAVSVQ